MTNRAAGLVVKSHVARDFLQSAGLFRTEERVVWEYVSNGLQYVDPGVKPTVRVQLGNDPKKITIDDNGRGMEWEGLQNFFIMHGENVDRKRGRPGRGLFGTGKSAAFGIAGTLRVTTVRNGKKSVVELNRKEIEAMGSGHEIPVTVIAKEEPTREANGTLVEIEKILLKSLNQKTIISFVEKHLSKWPKNATVYIGNHECEYKEPPIAHEYKYPSNDSDRGVLGDVVLTVNVSKRPLDEDERGISIYSKGVWYETTLAGSEGREMAHLIFGELDVPRLDEDKSKISPFDVSRSMSLNSSNEMVQHIYSFVGRHVEEVRRKLVADDKKRKEGEEAKKLAKHAHDIAEILNLDFEEFRGRLQRAIARVHGKADLLRTAKKASDDAESFLLGGSVPVQVVSQTGAPGSNGGSGGGGKNIPDNTPILDKAPPGADTTGKPANGSGASRKPRGGFDVRFDWMGLESPRAKYSKEDHIIHINLDHPQIAAAWSQYSSDSLTFRRLANEVAFVEYAIGLAYEKEPIGEFDGPADALFDVGETIDRLARRAAPLYANVD